MADSEKRTGEETIGKLSKEMLLECYTTDDIKEDYLELKRRLTAEGTTNRDFVQLLRLAWDFIIPKPKQDIGIETDKDIVININEGIAKDERNKS